ncbi:hypothetical protein [Bradyrhizobium sp.]|uniref:hypothetical protein n=1 Tax=Bradyrhizobium sp. TaxID=376 RepID=UPI001ED76B7D|nr:hypothetical protein [Bradyrhizobium sp.]MBV9984514.1 hypothetical protein [Bradyrhizobium sp.]
MPGFLSGPLSGFVDRMKGKGLASSSFLQQIGKSAAQAAGSGNIAAIVSAGINPGSINNDNVLAAWLIPANIFDIVGRGLQVTAMGAVANNTNSKRIKIFAGCTTAVVGSPVTGGVLIADSGAYNTAGAAGFQIVAQIFKYGAGGSNTQIALHQAATIGAAVGSLIPPNPLTLNESAPWLLAVTGNAVTAVADIALNFGEVFATN